MLVTPRGACPLNPMFLLKTLMTPAQQVSIQVFNSTTLGSLLRHHLERNSYVRKKSNQPTAPPLAASVPRAAPNLPHPGRCATSSRAARATYFSAASREPPRE